MSWGDSLGGTIAGAFVKAEQAAVSGALQSVLSSDGLQAIIGKLQQAGFGDEVASWLDRSRANLPITPDQLRAALGDEHVQQLAKLLNISVDDFLVALTKALPQATGPSGTAAQAPA